MVWEGEGVSAALYTASVEGIDQAIPVLVDTNNGLCGLMVDPKRRIIVFTDSEISGFDVTNPRTPLFQNLQAWAVNTAQYGTHFSDYFWNSARVLLTAPQEQQ